MASLATNRDNVRVSAYHFGLLRDWIAALRCFLLFASRAVFFIGHALHHDLLRHRRGFQGDGA